MQTGCLIAYGANLRRMFLQSGPYVDRVLQSSADQRLTADAEARHTERATADRQVKRWPREAIASHISRSPRRAK